MFIDVCFIFYICLIIPMFALLYFIMILAVCIVVIFYFNLLFFISHFALTVNMWYIYCEYFQIIFLHFHLALQTHYDHLVHFIFIPAMNVFSSSAIQELFTDLLCYIIGWNNPNLLKKPEHLWKSIAFQSNNMCHVVNALFLLTTSSKVVKDFLWQKSVFDHILWKSVGRPTITHDYPHAILSGKGGDQIL